MKYHFQIENLLWQRSATIDIQLVKLFTIIGNKADFFSIKNKNITFKNVKSN